MQRTCDQAEARVLSGMGQCWSGSGGERGGRCGGKEGT